MYLNFIDPIMYHKCLMIEEIRATALFLAIKVDVDIYTVSPSIFIYYCKKLRFSFDNSEEELLAMEREITKALDFNFIIQSPRSFLTYYEKSMPVASRVEDYKIPEKHFLTLMLAYPYFIGYKPSLWAKAAYYLTIKTCDKNLWRVNNNDLFPTREEWDLVTTLAMEAAEKHNLEHDKPDGVHCPRHQKLKMQAEAENAANPDCPICMDTFSDQKHGDANCVRRKITLKSGKKCGHHMCERCHEKLRLSVPRGKSCQCPMCRGEMAEIDTSTSSTRKSHASEDSTLSEQDAAMLARARARDAEDARAAVERDAALARRIAAEEGAQHSNRRRLRGGSDQFPRTTRPGHQTDQIPYARPVDEDATIPVAQPVEDDAARTRRIQEEEQRRAEAETQATIRTAQALLKDARTASRRAREQMPQARRELQEAKEFVEALDLTERQAKANYDEAKSLLRGAGVNAQLRPW